MENRTNRRPDPGFCSFPLLFPQNFFVRLPRYSSDSLGGSFRPIRALFDFRATIFLRLALVLMEIKFVRLRPGANLERLNVAGLTFHKASFLFMRWVDRQNRPFV
jgi:hypothetical protein